MIQVGQALRELHDLEPAQEASPGFCLGLARLERDRLGELIQGLRHQLVKP